jgi:hypothetical protein
MENLGDLIKKNTKEDVAGIILHNGPEETVSILITQKMIFMNPNNKFVMSPINQVIRAEIDETETIVYFFLANQYEDGSPMVVALPLYLGKKRFGIDLLKHYQKIPKNKKIITVFPKIRNLFLVFETDSTKNDNNIEFKTLNVETKYKQELENPSLWNKIIGSESYTTINKQNFEIKRFIPNEDGKPFYKIVNDLFVNTLYKK